MPKFQFSRIVQSISDKTNRNLNIFKNLFSRNLLLVSLTESSTKLKVEVHTWSPIDLKRMSQSSSSLPSSSSNNSVPHKPDQLSEILWNTKSFFAFIRFSQREKRWKICIWTSNPPTDNLTSIKILPKWNSSSKAKNNLANKFK